MVSISTKSAILKPLERKSVMMRPENWSASTVLSAMANLAWQGSQFINRRLPSRELPEPNWAPGKLMRSWERSSPQLGFPRTTKSLCPKCNAAAVNAFVSGACTLSEFRAVPGVIDAEIVEEAGRILMRKACDRHGPFEDVLATNAAFFKRMESLYTGGDFECTDDASVHDHGPLAIRSGRGMMLVFDLTNRCNMKCSPCYMNANDQGYVHELEMSDVKDIFQRALSFKPRREVNVLFAGGEPTLSPIFLDVVRYGRSVGFKRLHVATNGIRFAEDPLFAVEARSAGLHAVYLQLDGTSNQGNWHRGVSNLFDVKVRALENIARAGMRTTLQVAVVNGGNNHGVGEIVRFAVENIDKIHGVVFQPIMLAGRDQDVRDEDRYSRRYTLSQLADDLKQQALIDWEPLRDWFPMSVYGTFANLLDLMKPNAEVGTLYADVHPNWGQFSPLLVNRKTKQFLPVSSFFNVERFMSDLVAITDGGRGETLTKAQLILSVLRNYHNEKAPAGLSPAHLAGLFKSTVLRFRSDIPDWSDQSYAEIGEWRLLVVTGIWFQDLYVADLSALRMCTTPVVTQEGEISFCAYNGAGWRQVVEHLHKTATLREWHKEHERHKIYANGALVKISSDASSNENAEHERAADVVAHYTGR